MNGQQELREAIAEAEKRLAESRSRMDEIKSDLKHLDTFPRFPRQVKNRP